MICIWNGNNVLATHQSVKLTTGGHRCAQRAVWILGIHAEVHEPLHIFMSAMRCHVRIVDGAGSPFPLHVFLGDERNGVIE